MSSVHLQSRYYYFCAASMHKFGQNARGANDKKQEAGMIFVRVKL